MLIDWFTVSAQIINFLILLWLLKRFLYQPVLDAIAAREQHISSALASADVIKFEAEQERIAFQKKNTEFDQQKAQMLADATDEAEQHRQHMVDQAREEADALRNSWKLTLQRDQQNFNEDLALITQEQVFSIARKTLEDLAGVSLESHICSVFIDRLKSMDDQTKEQIFTALSQSAEPALVRTAFALTDALQAEIKAALVHTFAENIPVTFNTNAQQVAGIELSVQGHKLAWSVKEYLSSLSQSINQRVSALRTSHASAAVVPGDNSEENKS